MRVKVMGIVIVATVLYAILGGVAFHYIEQRYEVEMAPQILHDLSLYTVDAGAGNCLNWSDFLLLSDLLQDMNEGGVYISSYGQLVNVSKWDLRTAIFAAISVITSVGYHTLAPDFLGSRVFCIFYSWIGIPLFFCSNVVVGKLTVKIIKGIAKRIWGINFHRIARFALTIIAYDVVLFVLLVLIPAAIFSRLEKWSYADSVYFCTCSLFAIGFGELTPGFNYNAMSENFLHWYRLAVGFWLLMLVMAFVSQVLRLINFIDNSADETEVKIDRKLLEAKEFVSSEEEAKWFGGTTVMIQDDLLRRKSGKAQVDLSPNINVFPANGSAPENLTGPSGFVNVITLSQNN